MKKTTEAKIISLNKQPIPVKEPEIGLVDTKLAESFMDAILEYQNKKSK